MELARRLLRPEVRQHRLAGDRYLADADEELGRERHIDVDARPEADQAEALAGAEFVPRPNEPDDAAGDEPGDLHDADPGRRRFDDERVAFVVFAGLVELGVEEEP